MRAHACVVLLVLFAGSTRQTAAQETDGTVITGPKTDGTGTPDSRTLDQIIDRIIARKHYEYIVLSYFHPILETHIQDEKQHGEEEVPWRRWDLRGRANISADLSVRSIGGKEPDVGYEHVGFLQEAFIDRAAFDRAHYSFQYVGREDIDGVRCMAFDVAPLAPSTGGRFRGRIWANDTDYTIVRFQGTYMPLHHWELVPTPVRHNVVFTDFDSRRSSTATGIWLPSSILSRKSDLSDGRTHWNFNSETRFVGYSSAEIENPKIPAYNQEAFQRPVLLRRHLGRSFWIPWMVNFGLMMTANVSTVQCLASHQCQEGDPLVGRHPPAAQIYGVRTTLFAIVLAVAARSKLRGHETLWHYDTYAPMILYTIDTYHDLTDTAVSNGKVSPAGGASARETARARLMNDLPLR